MNVTVQDRDAYLARDHGTGVETLEGVDGAYESKDDCVEVKRGDDRITIEDSVIIASSRPGSEFCEECGNPIEGLPKWIAHGNFDSPHEEGDPVEREPVVVFCSDECQSCWSFDRAMNHMKSEREQALTEAVDEDN